MLHRKTWIPTNNFMASADDILFQQECPNQFPAISPEDFTDGFHDEMGALQGVDDTSCMGGKFSFETTLLTSQFARGLVLSFSSELVSSRAKKKWVSCIVSEKKKEDAEQPFPPSSLRIHRSLVCSARIRPPRNNAIRSCSC
jgi:hypothetical protein